MVSHQTREWHSNRSWMPYPSRAPFSYLWQLSCRIGWSKDKLHAVGVWRGALRRAMGRIGHCNLWFVCRHILEVMLSHLIPIQGFCITLRDNSGEYITHIKENAQLHLMVHGLDHTATIIQIFCIIVYTSKHSFQQVHSHFSEVAWWGRVCFLLKAWMVPPYGRSLERITTKHQIIV